jgi:rare lipoprotein A
MPSSPLLLPSRKRRAAPGLPVPPRDEAGALLPGTAPGRRGGSRRLAAWAACAVALALAACGSTPKGGGPRGGPLVVERDGAGTAAPPRNLEKLPDAVPRIEPIRAGGPNRPYELGGRSYTPFTHDRPFSQRGLASWYGSKFHGRRTANGEVYDMYAMTAAHPTMPLPSYVRVRNPANDREVILRVNDRGPFHPDRILDLSYAAAFRLGLLRGVGMVELERITHQDIRSGAWRRGSARSPAPPAEDDDRPAPAEPSEPDAALAAAAAGALASAGLVTTGLTPGTTTEAVATAGSSPPPGPAGSASAVPPAAAQGFWVQLAAFRDADGAADFRRRVEAEVDWLGPLLALVPDRSLHRLQAGPYASRDDAQAAAQRIREALQLVPLVVERR